MKTIMQMYVISDFQGADPPEALEFSANKGLQDGRQE